MFLGEQKNFMEEKMMEGRKKATVLFFAGLVLLTLSGQSLFAVGGQWTFSELWSVQGGGAILNPESAFYDEDTGYIYVANTGDGSGAAKNGFLSIISLDGKVVNPAFTKGLAGPRGTWVNKQYVYTAEVSALVQIDKATGSIVKRFPCDARGGPQQLNDIVEGPDGTIYVSDLLGDKIWALKPGASAAEIWLESPELNWPNGLRIEGGKMYLSPWGHGNADWSTDVLSHMLVINLKTKAITKLGKGGQIGYMDGLTRLDNKTFAVTNWWDGKVVVIDSKTTTALAEKIWAQSTGDIFYISKAKILLIPIGNDNRLVAVELVKK
jgi:outer membrane protein assembly factor BamB